ncbi:MAG: response regulator [Candidatus Synoicihabitans palmerolidicus]|nr:response regulator [Candidatus Synoicihabitans palmerolidicus]
MSTLSTPHAVIVDDEQSYLDLLGVILSEHLSCPVAKFTRPVAALSAISNLKIGIIVTDFYMPEIDGLEFLSRVEKLSPRHSFHYHDGAQRGA